MIYYAKYIDILIFEKSADMLWRMRNDYPTTFKKINNNE